MGKKYNEINPVVKLTELVQQLIAKNIEMFFIHHPQLTATLNAAEATAFAADHPNQFVKILHQDLDIDKHMTYLYLGIDSDN